MGLLSDFFIASRESMSTYSQNESFPEEDRCQYKYITPLEAGGLFAAIVGEGSAVDKMAGFELQTPEEAEEWTTIVPQEMRDALLGMDADSTPTIAARCPVYIDTLDYTQDDYESLLTDLKALAQRAADTSKEMYLWNCL